MRTRHSGRSTRLAWLLLLTLLLRALVPLGVHASSIPTAPPPVTMHLAYTYDNANRRTGLTLPDGKSESWGYDAAGRVRSLTQAGSSPNTYTVSHNGAGDITTVMAPNV